MESIRKLELEHINDEKPLKLEEVSSLLGIKPHVLRVWESEHPELRHLRSRNGGSKLYRARDVALFLEIQSRLFGTPTQFEQKTLVHEQAQRSQTNISHDAELSQKLDKIQEEIQLQQNLSENNVVCAANEVPNTYSEVELHQSSDTVVSVEQQPFVSDNCYVEKFPSIQEQLFSESQLFIESLPVEENQERVDEFAVHAHVEPEVAHEVMGGEIAMDIGFVDIAEVEPEFAEIEVIEEPIAKNIEALSALNAAKKRLEGILNLVDNVSELTVDASKF